MIRRGHDINMMAHGGLIHLSWCTSLVLSLPSLLLSVIEPTYKLHRAAGAALAASTSSPMYVAPMEFACGLKSHGCPIEIRNIDSISVSARYRVALTTSWYHRFVEMQHLQYLRNDLESSTRHLATWEDDPSIPTAS